MEDDSPHRCFGMCCPHRGRCEHYREVETASMRLRPMDTCAQHGQFPMFLARKVAAWPFLVQEPKPQVA